MSATLHLVLLIPYYCFLYINFHNTQSQGCIQSIGQERGHSRPTLTKQQRNAQAILP
jgi:hypothetical protein